MGRKFRKHRLAVISAVAVAAIPGGSLPLIAGLLVALLGLLIAYFATAVIFVVSGFLCALVGLVTIISPDLFLEINRWAGEAVFQFGPFQGHPHAPALPGIEGLAPLLSLVDFFNINELMSEMAGSVTQMAESSLSIFNNAETLVRIAGKATGRQA